jgi:hypothetical protein
MLFLRKRASGVAWMVRWKRTLQKLRDLRVSFFTQRYLFFGVVHVLWVSRKAFPILSK